MRSRGRRRQHLSTIVEPDPSRSRRLDTSGPYDQVGSPIAELHLLSDGIEQRGRLTVNSIKPVALGLVAGQSHPRGERFRERLKRIDPAVVADGFGRPLVPEHFVEGMP
jgi:hypothetical protein